MNRTSTSLDYAPPPLLVMREMSQDDMVSRESSLTHRGSCIELMVVPDLYGVHDHLPSPKSTTTKRSWLGRIFKKLFHT